MVKLSPTLKIFKFLGFSPAGFFCNTVVVIHFPGFRLVFFPWTLGQQQLTCNRTSIHSSTQEEARFNRIQFMLRKWLSYHDDGGNCNISCCNVSIRRQCQ